MTVKSDGNPRDVLEAALRRVTERLEAEPDAVDELFGKAQLLAKLGRDEAAKSAFLSVLQRDPTHFGALTDLGALALATGYRTAALTAYRQAVTHHADNPYGLVNLANLLLEDNDLAAARQLYVSALRIDPELAYAHQGLAHVLTKIGDIEAAAAHRDKGYARHSIVTRPYRGTGNPLRVLLIVSVRGGNIPTNLLLDDRIFAVTALYAEYHDPLLPLPGHDIIFNAIGDADLCEETLKQAAHIVARSPAPVINRPQTIMGTGRSSNARSLANLDGVVFPRTIEISRDVLEGPDAASALVGQGLAFPLLLRSPGFHTGQNFLRVETSDDLASAVRHLPGDPLLAIQFLDAAGADGVVRKYRVMMINGALYPLHLAISRNWKVHYFTSDMAADPALREEEQRFLANMANVIGRRAQQSLMQLCEVLGLDYGGADFALSRDGRILLFEINATMAIVPPPPEPIWDYRRPSVTQAIDATRQMLFTRAGFAQ
ncbi:MAG: tetratricopeptide repeat protein [Rhizomicrobium sp.]